LSSGIPTGAAAFYYGVYAAHYNLRCFSEKNLHNNAILRSTSDAEEEEELATPSAARLFLYSYVQRNTYSFLDLQDNTTQYLERVWFDYCSVHVSTVSSHSALWFSSLSQYRRMKLLHSLIRNHVDKYVITKHKKHQLMPVSLATFLVRNFHSVHEFILVLDSESQLKATWQSYALGYASGKILKISNFLKYSPRLYPQATPEGK
ncbi:hypothetical protein T06_8429, partial [Trichinella sp. T6]